VSGPEPLRFPSGGDWGSAMPDKSSRGRCGLAGSAAGVGGVGTRGGDGSSVQGESDVPGLCAAMAGGSAKGEEIRREVAGLKV
jgi:hypothetical protein